MLNDYKPELGKPISGTQLPLRDAIHVAVYPIIAGETLYPGQPLKLKPDGRTRTVIGNATITTEGLAAQCLPPLGILDPFLPDPIHAGDSAWMLICPNTITSLRHDWTHPGLPVHGHSILVREAEQWLTEFAHELTISREELVDGAYQYLTNEEPLTISADLTVSSDRFLEFWRRFSTYTERQLIVPPDPVFIRW